MIKLSIIIPCYNCSEFVSETVESVIHNCDQNTTEILLINDESKDDTLTVLKQLEKKYSIIKVVDKKNEGVSATRNHGISIAAGEYIGFVDSDDIIINDMFIHMVNAIESNDADIVCCSFLEQTKGIKYKSKYKYNNEIINREEALKKFLVNKISIAVWDKIYKKSILENVKFDINFAIGEDTLFCYDAIDNAKRIFLLDLYGYIYVQRNGSAVHSVSEKILEVSEVVHNITIKEKSLVNEYNYFCAYSMMRSINTLSYQNSKETNKEIVKLISKIYKKEYIDLLLKSQYSTKSLKLECYILKKMGIKFHLRIFKSYDLIKKMKNFGGK